MTFFPHLPSRPPAVPREAYPSLPDTALRQLPEPLRGELLALPAERDPELYAEALYHFAQRQERVGRLPLAVELYQVLLAGPASAYRNRAQLALDAILGRGAFGARAEFLMRNFAEQASDPSALLAMGVAGAVFRMTRLAALARLTGSVRPGLMTQFLGAGRLASLAGFAVEAPTFTLVHRFGDAALGRSQDRSGEDLARELASSYLTLGGLRLAGAGAVLLAEGQAVPLRHLLHQGGMLTGILLGHRLEEWAGLRPRQAGATTLVDSLALLLQFHVAGRLSRAAFGHDFAAWEAGLDRQAELMTRPPPGSGPRPIPIPNPARRLAWASGGAEVPVPVGPTVLMMSGRGRDGGDDWRAGLFRASNLRLRISPADAYQRRADNAADYVKQVQELTPGHAGVMTEILMGLDLFGSWLEGGDPFRRAIGFRHHAELWRVLANKWTHVSLTVSLTEAFRDQIRRQIRLLAQGSNQRFLAATLEGAPEISRIYSHTLGALVEGSPRERELTQTLLDLLAALRGGALAPNPSVQRGLWLEAFHASLNYAANERLGFAREALRGIQGTRAWLGSADPERQLLGRRYFPLFWNRLAERGHPEQKDPFLSEVQEEVAFLQQSTSPQRVPKETLLAALQAYPHYAEWVFNLLGDHPLQGYMLLNTFLGQARTLRPWISGHSDAEVRETCAASYLRVLSRLNRQAEALRDFPNLPTPIGSDIVAEAWEGIPVFEQRWQGAPGPDAMISALRDYLQLLDLLPPEARFGRELSAESRLKPLVRLSMHQNPTLRRLAEDAMEKILTKFPSGPTEPSGGN
ncbi:MAG: hypothetical protein U1F66_04715 [bacterium]